ncbi:hypothetical protein [Oribacterium sp. P6A1]|uniref:hypothetical protein n=1 Tax=Oribacterium sp. P6A1 TaxID=1410612 RepID=UPI00055A03E1|nr:hypothetical protein [Oribacterium sp. P6A1]
MNEEDLRREILEAGGLSAWEGKSDPVEMGIKMASLVQFLKDKSDFEQKAYIDQIRFKGLDGIL